MVSSSLDAPHPTWSAMARRARGRTNPKLNLVPPAFALVPGRRASFSSSQPRRAPAAAWPLSVRLPKHNHPLRAALPFVHVGRPVTFPLNSRRKYHRAKRRLWSNCWVRSGLAARFGM